MLNDYISGYLGDLATQLGWEIEGTEFSFIVSEALSDYGVDTEEKATNLQKLYALTRVQVWKAVIRAVSFDIDFSADGSSFKRSQLRQMANENLVLALSDALPYSMNYQIETGEVTYTQDPYQYQE